MQPNADISSWHQSVSHQCESQYAIRLVTRSHNFTFELTRCNSNFYSNSFFDALLTDRTSFQFLASMPLTVLQCIYIYYTHSHIYIVLLSANIQIMYFIEFCLIIPLSYLFENSWVIFGSDHHILLRYSIQCLKYTVYMKSLCV